MHYAGTRHPLAQHNPLRSLPLLRPAHRVIGWTPAQVAVSLDAHKLRLAQAAVRNATALVEDARDAYCDARREIGDANRGIRRGFRIHGMNQAQRRDLRSQAFREFNARLRLLREAEAKLAAAQGALADLLAITGAA